MTRPRLVAHTVVRNEECWVWYALRSALPFVDQILVWDTGSVDRTVPIIKSIHSPKLKFRTVPLTPDESALSRTRQRMLQSTRAGWLMILDGDEVWPESSLKQIVDFIAEKGRNYDSIIVPTLNCVGDIFHICSQKSGHYKIAGQIGHYNLRFINLHRVKGLHVSNLPGKLQGYFDGHGVQVQDRDHRRIAFLDAPYLHLTHLTRSRQRRNETAVYWRAVKKRIELGLPMPENFVYPQVFRLSAPAGSAFPWTRRSRAYVLAAHLFRPARSLKRLFF